MVATKSAPRTRTTKEALAIKESFVGSLDGKYVGDYDSQEAANAAAAAGEIDEINGKPVAVKEETPEEKPEDKKEEKTEAKPASFSWDDLPEAAVAEYTRVTGPAGVDIEKETPEAIKKSCQRAWDVNAERVAANVANARKAVWVQLVQPCGTKERAEAFVKLAKRYAKFRDWTFRGGIDVRNPDTVRFYVKPVEVRTRKDKATDVPPVKVEEKPEV